MPYPIGPNTANFDNCASWNGLPGNITSVGTNGGTSAYGTYDMAGNVWEWNEDSRGPGNKVLRGGNYGYDNNYLSSSYSNYGNLLTRSNYIGFRIASYSNYTDLLLVSDTNNLSDNTGFGSVDYEYYIAKYEVTNSEYVEFLNSVASTDAYGLYDSGMSSGSGGITRSGTSGSYSYTVSPNMGNKPVVCVSWFDCARYCNWLHNGKPTGLQNNSTTEDGAYTLNGAVSGNAVSRNTNASYWIPTENEWYKAAYYKGGGTNAGYWKCATQSNTDPTCVSANSIGDGPFSSNYSCSWFSVSPSPTPTQTVTPTNTVTPTVTPTITVTPTRTITPTPTLTPISPKIINKRFQFYQYLKKSNTSINSLPSNILDNIDSIYGVNNFNDGIISWIHNSPINSLSTLETYKSYLIISRQENPSYYLYNDREVLDSSTTTALSGFFNITKYKGTNQYLNNCSELRCLANQIFAVNTNGDGIISFNANSSINSLNSLQKDNIYLFITNNVPFTLWESFEEKVDDRVTDLLKAGNNIVLEYKDITDKGLTYSSDGSLTISTTGLQPSGFYIKSDIEIADGSDRIKNAVALTEIEYENAIKQNDTLYFITDASRVDGSGTSGYIPKWKTSNTIQNSVMYESDNRIGINNNNPNYVLDVNGIGSFSNGLLVSGVPVSTNDHNHTASNITDFNTKVSGLLPIITNSGDSRILTSVGTSVGVNAESNLKFLDRFNSSTGIAGSILQIQHEYRSIESNGTTAGLNLIAFGEEEQSSAPRIQFEKYRNTQNDPQKITENSTLGVIRFFTNDYDNIPRNGARILVNGESPTISGYSPTTISFNTSSGSGLLDNSFILTSNNECVAPGFLTVQGNTIGSPPFLRKDSLLTIATPSGLLESAVRSARFITKARVTPDINLNLSCLGAHSICETLIPSGVTNSGIAYGFAVSSLRNSHGNNFSSWYNDDGILVRQIGMQIHYGTVTGDIVDGSGNIISPSGNPNPTTLLANGLLIHRSLAAGTIETSIDIQIPNDPHSGGNSIVSYGIWQQNLRPNIFNGSVTVNDGLSAPKKIFNLGTVTGNISISYDIDKQIQTLTLNGTTTNFIKGSWPTGSFSVDVLLEITVDSTTTVSFALVDDWYNSVPSFTPGKYLVLLRSMGSTIQGHYIGNKTN